MYGSPRDPKSMKAAKFLKKLYKVRGIEKHFDAINAHPYGSDIGDVKKRVNELRSVSSGRATATSTFSSASSAGRRRVRRAATSWSARRARRIASATGSSCSPTSGRSWNVLGAYVYTWRDFPAGQLACNWCPWSGLVTKKSKPKPALRAVKKVIRKSR